MKLTLKLLNECFTIHSLPEHSVIPPQVFAAPIYFIAKTFDEVLRLERQQSMRARLLSPCTCDSNEIDYTKS